MEDWRSPGRCQPAASSSRPEDSSGLGGSSEVGVPGTDLLVMKGRRGQARRRCVAARAQAALLLAQVYRLRRLALCLIGGRAGGDARAVRNHEWPKEVNSTLPRVQTEI